MNKFKLGLATLLAVAGFSAFIFSRQSYSNQSGNPIIRVGSCICGHFIYDTRKAIILIFQDSVEEVKSCLAQ